jgi:hypothetical protein
LTETNIAKIVIEAFMQQAIWQEVATTILPTMVILTLQEKSVIARL